MTTLRHAVFIEKPLSDVYRLAENVERYPDYLPGYLESRIIKKDGRRVLLQRKAIVGREVKEWKSWASFETNKMITFEHAEGPLTGMRVEWLFREINAGQTELVVIHRFNLRDRSMLQWVREEFFYRPKIDALATQIVESFKQACERPLEVFA